MLGRIRSAGLLAIALLTVTLAGCADSAPGEDEDVDDAPEVEATSTTGGIRGVIVDEAIVPIADATVTVLQTEQSVTTDETGTFVFSGLDPGFYTIEASKLLYETVQQQAEVVAGVKDPDAVKVQISKITDATPYAPTLKFDGYIFCSLNLVVLLSEECGEGVGVEGVGRVGGHPDNNAQIDFFVESMDVKSINVEQVWEPSLSVGAGAQSGDFFTVFALDWACEPVCGGDRLADAISASPLYIQVRDTEEAQPLGSRAEEGKFDTDTLPFSTFTWASPDETGLLLEQGFTLYVTPSYVLPLPEGWSFVNGDDKPF